MDYSSEQGKSKFKIMKTSEAVLKMGENKKKYFVLPAHLGCSRVTDHENTILVLLSLP